MTDRAEGWLIDLHAEDHPWDDAACRAELSADEARRADRFRDPAAAVTYVRARSTVRRVLAHVFGGTPAQVRLGTEPDRRPYLPDHPDWYVSWSRTAGVLLVAVRDGAPIGVDAEVIRPVKSPAKVLRTFYPDAVALGAIDDPETFLSAWTLLEAAVKATGRGLAQGARDVRLYRPPGSRRCALGGIRGAGPVPWSGRTDRFAAPRSPVRVMTAVVTRGPAAPVRLNAWRLP
ncbi:4'-phosphopantetheinyl transferase family protein [Yinghuangia soli]|uniref:4'-phosphopantetheinyl transferase superfamily protein n=1 Tax=Yinghuangia soli TaxID=2908204 RepID=A0AA41Q128_9ACTN|nr:4'-phosphopantetheinyl transferase superfamily protein [Yinghuangia soli]MCF2528831.1 4'-phosphopantetheinyl transferase superfamily protein [Yinghuangia soli]